MIYNRILNRVTRWVSLVEKEVFSLPKLQISPLLFRGVHVAQSSVCYLVLCGPFFVILSRFFRHCIICHSRFTPLVYLYTLLNIRHNCETVIHLRPEMLLMLFKVSYTRWTIWKANMTTIGPLHDPLPSLWTKILKSESHNYRQFNTSISQKS